MHIETIWRSLQTRGDIPILAPFSFLYGILIRLHHFVYTNGWRHSKKLPIPVISIGNITAGGCGKTPFTHMLARLLAEKNQVAILSRGYRATKKHKDPFLAKDPTSGDEAYLLKSKLPQVQVWVGKNRAKAAERAQNAGATIILLDDGMQQKSLAKDVNIVLVDAKEPLNHLLPRGSLRDFPKQLENADLLVITHANTEPLFESIKTTLRKYSKAPFVRVSMAAHADIDLSGKRIGAFCGIAKPHHFFHMLSSLGAHLVHTTIAPDHKLPPLELFAKQSLDLGATHLVCTEKDRIKIPSDLKLPLPLVTLSIDMQVTEGQLALDTLIHRYTHG